MCSCAKTHTSRCDHVTGSIFECGTLCGLGGGGIRGGMRQERAFQCVYSMVTMFSLPHCTVGAAQGCRRVIQRDLGVRGCPCTLVHICIHATMSSMTFSQSFTSGSAARVCGSVLAVSRGEWRCLLDLALPSCSCFSSPFTLSSLLFPLLFFLFSFTSFDSGTLAWGMRHSIGLGKWLCEVVIVRVGGMV